MNPDQDMTACEARDPEGYPMPSSHPFANVTAGSGRAPMTTKIEQHADNSTGKQVNPALPWLTSVMAGGALFGMVVICLLQPWRTEARAAKAELRAEFAQLIADAQAEAKQAGDDAAIWKNRVMKLEAQSNAR